MRNREKDRVDSVKVKNKNQFLQMRKEIFFKN